MLVFVLNQAQKANTGKIQTPVYENVREFGEYNFGHRKTALLFSFLGARKVSPGAPYESKSIMLSPKLPID